MNDLGFQVVVGWGAFDRCRNGFSVTTSGPNRQGILTMM